MLGKVRQGDPRLQKWVETIAEQYEQVMITGIQEHERSNQKLIGPSEIGDPCNRAILYKLAQAPEHPRPVAKDWKATVGTACHSQQELWFSTVETEETTPADWEVEQKVAVGNIGSDTIRGSTDLYAKAGAVIDHKFVGKWKLDLMKAKEDPGPQYRVQAHTYGRGWALEGFPVHAVMIVFHPRDGDLDQSYYWWEPYDEQIALNALKRANDLHTLLTTLGLEQALRVFPYCSDRYCDWCSWDKRSHYDPAPQPASTETPAFYQN